MWISFRYEHGKIKYVIEYETSLRKYQVTMATGGLLCFKGVISASAKRFREA